MKLKFAAPESLVAERIEAERLAAFLDHFARVSSDLLIKSRRLRSDAGH
jgi:hypothetical protein